MRCLPVGARPSGSWAVGNTASMYGCSYMRPYFASSHARSRYSTLGDVATRPLWTSPADASHDGNVGSFDSATLSFTLPLRVRYRFTSFTTPRGNRSSPTSVRYVVTGCAHDTTRCARTSVPSM